MKASLVHLVIGALVTCACDPGGASSTDAGTQPRDPRVDEILRASAREIQRGAGSDLDIEPDRGDIAALIQKPAPARLQFVRLRAGDDVWRVGANGRARVVKGVPTDLSPPARRELEPLEALCTDPALTGALAPTAAGDQIIELDCGPTAGVIGCTGICSPEFTRASELVRLALAAPDVKTGGKLVVIATDERTGSAAYTPSNPLEPFWLTLTLGNNELPLRHGRGSAAAVAAARPLCLQRTGQCVEVAGAELVYVELSNDGPRFRCASCTIAPSALRQGASAGERTRSSQRSPGVARDRAIGGKITVQHRLMKRSGQGELSKEDIVRVVNQHIGEIQSCYEKQLRTHPGLAGRVVFDWTIDTRGRVTVVRTAQSSLSDADVVRCMMDKLKSWRFAAPKGGTVSVVLPFIANTI